MTIMIFILGKQNYSTFKYSFKNTSGMYSFSLCLEFTMGDISQNVLPPPPQFPNPRGMGCRERLTAATLPNLAHGGNPTTVKEAPLNPQHTKFKT